MPSSPAESGPLVSLEGQRQKDQCQLLVGSQGVPFSCPSSSAGGGGPGERSLHTVVESSQDCAQMDEHWPLRPCPCLKSKRLLRSLEIQGSSPVQWSIKKMVENDHRGHYHLGCPNDSWPEHQNAAKSMDMQSEPCGVASYVW